MFECVSAVILQAGSGLLAQAPAAGEKAPGFAETLMGMLPIMLPLIVLYVVIVVLPGNREKKKREELLNSLKKNDRVITTAGMIGSVANISSDGKEVTLKFGDSTRIPFVRSSIQTVLRDDLEEKTGAKAASEK
ncbi:preprotein translocase subunit YajC [Stratiformator vulcanicus]|uniref:Sec translocon accessory complex subunit YajC n=1 Tax=Stratiformator vulcanicus TaxID=2527980 RepID=A0A517R1W1_9PLAN|nr:preprotein translocase subunit YajC [Stratiformator vulcanicus]QDT37834.1 preprotein translocase subunit YajC [Stratiformator vulcanicus]